MNSETVKMNKEIEAAGLTEEQVAELAETGDTQTEVDSVNQRLQEAASQFMSTVPRVKALAKNMSRNGLARVFKAVVEFPLAESYPKFKGTEQELFVLTLTTLQAKNVLTEAFMAESGKEIRDQVEDKLVEELKEKANG